MNTVDKTVGELDRFVEGRWNVYRPKDAKPETQSVKLMGTQPVRLVAPRKELDAETASTATPRDSDASSNSDSERIRRDSEESSSGDSRPSRSFERAEPSRSIFMDIATEDVRLLIGFGGKEVKMLQAQTGVRISVEKKPDYATVTLRGPESLLADAALEVTQHVENKKLERALERAEQRVAGVPQAAAPAPRHSAEDSLEVHEDFLKELIGYQGANIHSLEKKTSTKIRVPPAGRLRVVSVRASAETAEAAKGLVQKALQLIAAEFGAWSVVVLQPWQVGTVIGWRGETMRWIQQTTGATLKVTDAPARAFIRGKTALAVEAAKRLVEEQAAWAPKPK